MRLLSDRRHADRRSTQTPRGEDRRRVERRLPLPSTWATLGFVIVTYVTNLPPPTPSETPPKAVPPEGG